MQTITTRTYGGGREKLASVPASSLFSEAFLRSLEGVGGMSLTSQMDQLVDLAENVVLRDQSPCKSGYAGMRQMIVDIDRYGAAAVVDVTEADIGVDGVDIARAGRLLSIREAMAVYSLASLPDGIVGADLVRSDNRVGMRLVKNDKVHPSITVSVGMDHCAKLGHGTRRREHGCECYVTRDKKKPYGLQWLLERGSRRETLEPPAVYEVVPGGEIIKHPLNSCTDFGQAAMTQSYLTTVDGLSAGVGYGYQRWLHEKTGLCCSDVGDPGLFTARKALGPGWLVSGHFLCKAGMVCPVSDFSVALFRAAGMFVIERGYDGPWYRYDDQSVKKILIDPGALERTLKLVERSHAGGTLICDVDITKVVLHCLVAWFDYTNRGSLQMSDVVRGCGFVDYGLGARMVEAPERGVVRLAQVVVAGA